MGLFFILKYLKNILIFGNNYDILCKQYGEFA